VLGRTSPPFRGMIYVHNPDVAEIVRPKVTHGARMRTVWPRIGYMFLSSTPPRKRALMPGQTMIAVGGFVP
jgi:hypothetical protein